MGLSRDRGDRPRLIGRGHERRDDRCDARGDRLDERPNRRSDQAHENRSVVPAAVLRRVSAACNRTRPKFLSGIPTSMPGTSTNLRDHPRQWAK